MQTDAVGWSDALGANIANPPVGSPVGEAIPFEGAVYLASPVNQSIRGQFEQYVRRNALEAIAEVQGMVHPDEAKKWMSCYIEDRAAGAYSWGDKNLNDTGQNGSAIRKALGDIPGTQYLFFLVLKACHPDMTQEKALKIFKGAGVLVQDLGNGASPQKGGDKPATETTPKNDRPQDPGQSSK